MHDLLAVPLKNSDGEVWNAQFISPDGKKRYFKQGRKRGLAFRIGTPGKFAVIVLAEGYATGASIFEATGLCVIVTFNKVNMLLIGSDPCGPNTPTRAFFLPPMTTANSMEAIRA